MDAPLAVLAAPLEHSVDFLQHGHAGRHPF